MKLLLFSLFLLPSLDAYQSFTDPVFAPLWDDRYKTQVIAPHKGFMLPGNFTHPPAANCNSTDFGRNERVIINSTYPLQWAWTNATKNITWDMYLVNERYEKRLIFRPVGSQKNMSGYLWKVKDEPNDPFLDSATMFFFYVVNRDGFWAEGFASRFVNISQAEVEALKMTSDGSFRKVGQFTGIPLLVAMVFLFIF